MARREWAQQAVSKLSKSYDSQDVEGLVPLLDADDVIDLVQREHARAVRIVNAEIKHVSRMTTIYNDVECLLVQAALKRVIDQLTKGRA